MAKGDSLLFMKSRTDWLLFAAILIVVIAGAIGFEYTDGGGQKPAFSAAPLDDSWIHFVYARAFATTLRFDYNPGQAEAGFSSMLWVILLAPFLLIHINPPLAAKILGLAAHIATAFLMYRWLRNIAPEAAAICAALMVAVDPVFTQAALSGMEVMPYALCMTAATALFFESRYKACALFLGLVALARPDGMIFVGILWFVFAIEALASRSPYHTDRRITGNDVLWVFLIPIAAVLLWVAYCLAATGRPVPNSYYVRAGGASFFYNLDSLDRILRDVSRTSFYLSAWWKAPLLLAPVYLLVKRMRKGILLLLFPPVFLALMGGEQIQIVGGNFLGNRYLIPVMPFVIALQVFNVSLIAVGIGWLARKWKHRDVLTAMVIVMLCTVYFFPPGSWWQRRQEMERDFAVGSANIEQMQVRIGKWIDENTAPDAKVAVFDAGAIRYLGNRGTLDILGLNNAGFVAEDPVTLKREADYLVTYPDLTPKLAEAFAGREVFRVHLQENIASAGDTMVVYKVR